MDLNVAVITLGCPKNEADSDFIKGHLYCSGYHLVSQPKEAQVIVLNTCGFIESAKRESIETILELSRYKEEGKCRVLAVVGCLAQRYSGELFDEIPEIDILLGLSDSSKLPEKIIESLNGKRILEVNKPSNYLSKNLSRIKPSSPSAYLKISDGCNGSCSYCAIPLIRGNYRSCSEKLLINEVKFLVKNSVKEIVLVGQDTSYYGKDIYGERKLSQLILKLSQIEGLNWIRLLYVQPDGFSKDLLTVFASNPKVCKYIDIPFQHSSKKILRLMKRKGSAEEYLSLLKQMREYLPDVAVRTSLMVGFPGETDDDFEELLAFVKAARLDYLGVFEYSAEEGTKASGLPFQILNEVKRERYHQLVALQDSITLEKNKSYKGKKMKVLVESREDGGLFLGRNQYQAPEIDGIVYLNKKNLKIGEFVSAKITGVDGYDLIGEVTC